MSKIKSVIFGVLVAFGFSAHAVLESSTDALKAPASFDFATWVKGFDVPQLYFDNAKALRVRLQLIDAAPSGSQLRLATFEFTSDASTQALFQALCRAAGRGVKIQFLTDAHSGSDPTTEEAFDASQAIKTNEEMYQSLANCGAEVTVHNSMPDYVTVVGSRLPNIFLDPSYNHTNPLAISAQNQINSLVQHAANTVDSVLVKNRIELSAFNILSQLKSIGLEMLQAPDVTSNWYKPSDSRIDSFVSSIEGSLSSLIDDKLWMRLPTSGSVELAHQILSALQSDTQISALLAEVRRFNRLNHKKFFQLETPDHQGCMIIGGRNLGDWYLANGRDSFHDADVMVCLHHGRGVESAWAEGTQSFQRLLTDTSDPQMKGGRLAVKLLKIPKRNDFDFRLYQPVMSSAVALTPLQLGDFAAPHSDHFQVLTSEWSLASDQIRSEVLRMTKLETREMFLESPYLQLDSDLRSEIHAAAQRGVRVTLITNGLYTSDKGSKLIRLTMEPWLKRMKRDYPDHFFVLFTTPTSLQMTHAKIAVFRGQSNALGQPVAKFLVGSHNFHPRSSLSDKEHAIVWEEPYVEGQADLIDQRFDFYNALHAKQKFAVLKSYAEIPDEVSDIKEMRQGWDDNSQDNISRVARNRADLYVRLMVGTPLAPDDPEGSWLFEENVKFQALQERLEGSGLMDLLGIFL